MSPLGQEATSQDGGATSALTLEADINRSRYDVCLVPISDNAAQQSAAIFIAQLPVEEPSTASQADIIPSRHFHELTWVRLAVVFNIKTRVEVTMKLRWFLVLLAVSASTLSAHAQDAKKAADEFATKWVTAYDAGDAAALAAMFTEDGVFNAPSGAVLKGRDAIGKALAGRMKAGWTKETVTTNDVGMAGNAVWIAGEYGLLGSGEVAGKQTGGHYGMVLVRDGDVWHVAMLTANVTPPK